MTMLGLDELSELYHAIRVVYDDATDNCCGDPDCCGERPWTEENIREAEEVMLKYGLEY